jgi:hypothetical protein
MQGYVAIVRCSSLKKRKIIVMPAGPAYGANDCAETLVQAMVSELGGADGPFFWASGWDLCVGNGLDDQSDAQVIRMRKIDGSPRPLWQACAHTLWPVFCCIKNVSRTVACCRWSTHAGLNVKGKRGARRSRLTGAA